MRKASLMPTNQFYIEPTAKKMCFIFYTCGLSLKSTSLRLLQNPLHPPHLPCQGMRLPLAEDADYSSAQR